MKEMTARTTAGCNKAEAKQEIRTETLDENKIEIGEEETTTDPNFENNKYVVEKNVIKGGDGEQSHLSPSCTHSKASSLQPLLNCRLDHPEERTSEGELRSLSNLATGIIGNNGTVLDGNEDVLIKEEIKSQNRDEFEFKLEFAEDKTTLNDFDPSADDQSTSVRDVNEGFAQPIPSSTVTRSYKISRQYSGEELHTDQTPCDFAFIENSMNSKNKFQIDSVLATSTLGTKSNKIRGNKTCTFKDCNYRCARNHELIIHIRRHTGERPFKCDICGSRFVNIESLKRHIKGIHKRIKPFKCTYNGCAYQSSWKWSLTVHMRSHTGETPFQCEICKTRFSLKGSLMRHKNKRIKCQVPTQNAMNSEDKLEISSVLSTYTSVTSTSKEIIENKTVVKMQFESAHLNQTESETNSYATNESQNNQRFSCTICGSTFSLKYNLIAHTKIYHDRVTLPLHKCYFCFKKWFKPANLFNHLRRHTKEQPFTCCNCGSRFVQEGNLNRHIKVVHEGLKDWKCTFKDCNYRFSTKSNLVNHSRTHTGETPFQCEICKKQFAVKPSLKLHKNRKFKCQAVAENPLNGEVKLEISSAQSSSSLSFKSKKRSKSAAAAQNQFKSVCTHSETNAKEKTTNNKRGSFPCEICGQSFSFKSNLAEHTKIIHNRLTRYECYFCCKKFFVLRHLFIHMVHHTKEQAFPCCICGLSFAHNSNLNQHIRTVHEGLKNFKCTFKDCDRRFSIKSNLKCHMKIHTEGRCRLRFKCYICESKFADRDALNLHREAAHAGSKRFKCTFKDCVGFQTDIKGNFIQHMSIHTKEPPLKFQCKICGSRFVDKNCLNAHIKAVHQGIKRFKCTFKDCDYFSTLKHNLKSHIKIHTKTEGRRLRFKCYICESKFADRDALNLHKEAAHAGVKRFKCTFKDCSYQTDIKSNVTKHMKIHIKKP